MELKAFHGKVELKQFYVDQVAAHYRADEIIHGKYWEDGRGCAIGCLVHSVSHADFETKLGIPKEIAYLIDGLFEALPNGEAKSFPVRVVNAITPWADLSMIIPQFLLWMLSDPKIGSIADAKYPETKTFVEAVIALFDQWVSTGQRPRSDSKAAWAAWAAWAARNKAAADKLIELLEAAS